MSIKGRPRNNLLYIHKRDYYAATKAMNLLATRITQTQC